MLTTELNQSVLDLFTVQAKAKAQRIRDLQDALIDEMAGLESLAKGAAHLVGDEDGAFAHWCGEATIDKDTLEMCANSVGVDPLLFDTVVEGKKAPRKNSKK